MEGGWEKVDTHLVQGRAIELNTRSQTDKAEGGSGRQITVSSKVAALVRVGRGQRACNASGYIRLGLWLKSFFHSL